VKVNSKKEHHKEAYNQVVAYYERALNIDIDTSGSDICRLCFVSYDEDCFIKNDADTFEVERFKKQAAKNDKSTSLNNTETQLPTFELLERCLKFTEQK